MLKCVNAPRFGSCETRGLANTGSFPSAAVIVEANQKLSSGGEGRVTSRKKVGGDFEQPFVVFTCVAYVDLA